MKRGFSIKDFRTKLKTEEDCLNYLLATKWGSGYKCIKCGCEDYVKGRQWFYRRYRKCKYDESVTANTMFHKCKLGLLRAFEIEFRVSVKKKRMSTTELGCEVGDQQKTAWLFKRKIQVAMKQDNKDKLKGNVDADGTLVGGYTNKNKGRSLESKEALLLPTEKLADGRTGNIRLQLIENFDALTLKFALKDMIDKEAFITTDHHRSYQSLKKEMNIQTVLSNIGTIIGRTS